jgi:hypothetical protein
MGSLNTGGIKVFMTIVMLSRGHSDNATSPRLTYIRSRSSPLGDDSCVEEVQLYAIRTIADQAIAARSRPGILAIV